MAEAAKVRLVRCPKCENLLPELPDFSLYQCGGCGAVLKAKSKGVLEDGLSEISNDSKVIGIPEESSIVNASEVVMEGANGTENGRVTKIHNERVTSSSSQAESRELLTDSDVSRRGKERVRRMEHLDDEQQRSHSSGLVRNRNEGKSYDYVKEVRPPVESLRSRPIMDQWGVKSNGPMASRGPAFHNHDEGPSNYDMNAYYENDDRMRYPSRDLNGLDTIENLEHGRAELLRKLDELKDQLTRSCEVGDKPKEIVGSDRRMVPPYGRHHAAYVQEGSTRPYLSQSHGFNPYTDRYGTSLRDPYPQRGYPPEFPGYADIYGTDMLRRPPHQAQSHYMHKPIHDPFPGYYGDENHDLFMLHQHENFFHQPACSCVHCCNKNWHLPPKVDPLGFHNRRSQNEPSNPNFHPISGVSNLHPFHSRQSLAVNSIDMDSENDGFNYHRPRKVMGVRKTVRVRHPIAGGAPFITCTNCFEVLKLSKKHISLEKNQQKMKCGACSSIILFELGNEGFNASISARIEQVPTEIDDHSSATGYENVRYWHGGSNSADLNDCSLTDKKSNSGGSQKQLDPLSPTSSLSENKHSPENSLSKKHDSPIEKLTLTEEEIKSFPQGNLSSQECSNHNSDNNVVDRFGKGNKSKRSEHEKVALDKTTSRQNSVKDAAMATEMDVSLNSCVSQDSVEISKEDHTKVKKGGESFLKGLVKKSFRDFTKSNHSVEVGGSQVYVNGHFIPDRVVKKAEKLAGPIQPGEYWYDIQAGFWGVMGHPCLGIIMPDIEEFNYPIPEKCAAGNTGVFINGRELHQKDFDLLASRGLPITRHRSYIVDISGKVVDEHTGEELDGLGRLAPTVEKAKHGFGMRVPRFIAESQS
ncbi:hypothetical protein ACJIZ3_001902 [Penstemon smallii]|uniref:Zinc-ribbon domain-containing protein n=1 Tax=Penstemon smallii TaxID=265156 RepID=A0ABD3U4X0_9LAMI